MHPERATRVVLLDLDDTLFDHRKSAKRAVGELCRSVPEFRAHPPEEIERVNRHLLEEIHLRVLAGEIDVDGARVERMSRLLAHFGGPSAPRNALRVARLYRESYSARRETVPGAHELLQELRRREVRMGVVTNNVTKEQEEKMEVLGLTPLVDDLIVSEAVGSWKPDVRIFEIALTRLGVAPEEAVMVGDSWSSDIVGAYGAGIPSVWYNPLGLEPPASPCPRPTEIQSLAPAAAVAETILSAGSE